jgi:hypothetical protein
MTPITAEGRQLLSASNDLNRWYDSHQSNCEACCNGGTTSGCARGVTAAEAADALAEIIVRVEGRDVARAGMTVRYHGSRIDMHGLYTLTGMCRCDDDNCDEVGGRELVDSDGRTLVHVNRASFTAA